MIRPALPPAVPAASSCRGT